MLPHCFNAQDACDPDKPYFRGQGWYRTRLAIHNPFAEGRTLLNFQGAGQSTTAWVGSQCVGTHTGGYDEFSFDITDAVRKLAPADAKAGVPIAVMCDNSPDLQRPPSDLSDFCLYGGLYRHLNLVYLPALALDTVHILPVVAADGTAQISVQARIYNPGALTTACSISIAINDSDGHVVHTSNRTLQPWQGLTELGSFRVSSPKLWSPESPHLYRCRVSLSTSTGDCHLDELFGLRTTEFVEHGPFKLNGKRVLLRGTHRHADHAGFAAAMPDDLVRQEMQMIRDMGANFIRLAHYQQDRLVLDLCDELGLMVWEEVPWCRSGVGDQAFQHNTRQMLEHMIDQHYNHPSVILWGLGNEDDWPDEYPSIDQQAIRAFMTELRDLAHGLDSSRLTSLRRCDFARDIPDVYSPSIWAGWYRGNYHEYEQTLLKERDRVKRLLHIEWGADSMAGRHTEQPNAVLASIPTGRGTDERGFDFLQTGGDPRASKDGDWSETYACHLFDWHLKTQEKLDWLTGAAQWIFKDFASPARGDNSIPSVNQKGVVERDLGKKESYYVFQSYWTEKPMAHIYGHSWPVRWGRPGDQRDVFVYSNCEHAELFLNGKSLGIKRRDSQDFPAAGLRWKTQFVAGQNRLRVIATRDGAAVTDEIDFAYQTQPWTNPATLKLVEKSCNGKLLTVLATLHDSSGVACLDARNVVRFSLAGDSKLIDNLGTARGSRELQMYNGRAEISINLSGACTVGISSDGIAPAFLNLTSTGTSTQA
jgi:beta-galactosidase